MGARNSEQQNKQVNFYSLKAKVDATNDPHFTKTEKVNDRWVNAGVFSEMFGVITKAEIITKTFDGVDSNIFRLTLSDSEETSFVDMTHNAVTYSILNSLSGEFDTSKEVSISVYKTSVDKDGKTYYNGKASVKSQGEGLGWTVPGNEIPRAAQVFMDEKKTKPLLVSGKKVYDSEPVKKFWEELFNTKVKDKFSSKNAPSQLPKAVSDSPFVDDEESDLPF